MDYIVTPAREAAADYLANILVQAFETVSLEDIEKAFECTTEEAMTILFEMGTATSAIYWDVDEFDEQADIVVGDADPSDYEQDDEAFCLETNGRYYCTRNGGHPGKHIAGDGVEVCAVWQ